MSIPSQYEVAKLVAPLLNLPDGMSSSSIGFKFGENREVYVRFNASAQAPLCSFPFSLPPLPNPLPAPRAVSDRW